MSKNAATNSIVRLCSSCHHFSFNYIERFSFFVFSDIVFERPQPLKMISRSASSRKRKTPRTKTSPQRSTNSLVRKHSVAFENVPDDAKDADRDAELASAAPRPRGSSNTNLTDYPSSSRSGSSIKVTGTDEYNSPIFPVYSPEKMSSSETAISLNEYPQKSPQTSRSAAGGLQYDSGSRLTRSSVTPDDVYGFRGLQNTDFMGHKPRTSLAPELQPSKSPRSSLVPEDAYNNRGSRGSIDPSMFNRGSRNSLLPDIESYNRLSRPSMVADVTALRNSRCSLANDSSPNRSPRNSLLPDGTRSSRSSLLPDSTNRSPRNSLVPDSGSNRTPRGSFASTAATPGDTTPSNRTPRGSLVSECSMYSYNRNSRSSLPLQDGSGGSLMGKSPRGSIASATGVQFDLSTKTPRGSIESVPPGTYIHFRI